MKDGFISFQIPILGLDQGEHRYNFRCENDFFASFEKTLVDNGLFEVEMVLDKKVDTIEMVFNIQGTIETICDRCTAPISLPIKGNALLVLKYAEKESEEDEIVFITRDRDSFNIADFLHESIELLLPFSNTYDCENTTPKPCDEKVLELLKAQSKKIKIKKEDNPIWDSLKDLNLEN